MFMIHLHTKLYSGSLVITIKPNAKDRLHATVILLFHILQKITFTKVTIHHFKILY